MAQVPATLLSGHFTFQIVPERTPQLALKDFTRARERQWFGPDSDAKRAFVAGDSFLAEGDEIGRIERRARLYDDDCVDRFPPFGSGTPMTAHWDGRVLGERVLHFDRIDVLAAGMIMSLTRSTT